ncbi:MAG TPA: EthD family reductase [Blastocatellia bacterium]|nr:EthD family reductase [Blastocatellia bacterium]
MIRVSIFYPNKPGGRFDLDYYLNRHMPMTIETLGESLKGVTVEYGLTGGAPDVPPPYVVMCHLLFDSVESFLAAFMPHAAVLQGDIPNYTDAETGIQISEVKLSR